MTPKIAKMKPKTSSKKLHIPRHEIYDNFLNPWPYFSRKSASFSIRSTNFTYPVFSWSIPATPENNQKMSQKGTLKHPKICQNSCSKKHWFLASILVRFWLQKWHQNGPKIDQNGTLGLPRAFLGPLGGARGHTRCLKTDFWLQFGIPNDPKMTPNEPQIDQNSTLGLPKGPLVPLGGARGPPGASRPTFGSNLAPQITPKLAKWHQHTPNWAQNVPKWFQRRPKWHPSNIKGGGRRHWRSHQYICRYMHKNINITIYIYIKYV